jgi:hypothetical protein
MPSVKKYNVAPLKFDTKLAEEVTHRQAAGETISAIARDLKMTPGRAKMAILVASAERVQIDDPAKLARAIAKDRKRGDAWAVLCARYGVTEGTVRAAYTAATGQPFTELDYRNGKEAA